MDPKPTPKDYLKLAEECYRLANEAKSETDRLACLDLARNWLDAAAREEEKQKLARDDQPKTQ
jgi:hypothetical protein